jgi:hypothetical protein
VWDFAKTEAHDVWDFVSEDMWDGDYWEGLGDDGIAMTNFQMTLRTRFRPGLTTLRTRDPLRA